MSDRPVNRILVIRLDALADIVLAFGAFDAIRRFHAGAHITLLTTRPYAELARKSGWFDEVWDDGKPARRQLRKLFKLTRRLRRGRFDRVYDLQNSSRTAYYRTLSSIGWGKAADWSRAETPRGNGTSVTEAHRVEAYAGQLAAAGIEDLPFPDLSWLTEGYGGRFGLSDGYVLMVPGCMGRRADGVWPTERYAELARRVAIEGQRPVLIGTHEDIERNRVIAAATPEVLNLTDKAGLFDLAALAAHAKVAVGHNSGPIHLIAALGCPSVVLFPGDAGPGPTTPRGRLVVNVREDNLAALPVTEVAAALRLG